MKDWMSNLTAGPGGETVSVTVGVPEPPPPTAQDYEMVAVDRISTHPDNARRGNMEVIRESIRVNGFYGACVVQRSTGHILIGNHRYRAAIEEGLTEVPIVWVDKSDEEARRLLLVDNRTSDLAVYDDEALVELLAAHADDGGWAGTGWDDVELAVLLAVLDETEVEAVSSDEWYTPKWLFDSLAIEFDLDPCSCDPARGFVPATVKYTKEDDGLAQPWQGRVWMNPPFSRPQPWVQRFIEHGHGIALLPTSSTGKWVDSMWDAVDGVVLARSFSFVHPDGEERGNAPFRNILWAMGDDCVEAIGRVSRVRR